MLGRIVSVVQIVAIIACPLWCGNGWCHADTCCSVKQPSDQFCPDHGTAKCCCKKSSSEHDNRGPCRCPNKTCQGVCGGAVFEKPVELNDASESHFLPVIDSEISFALQLSECHSLDAEHHFHGPSGNYGRFVRTLHMSFLC